MQGWQLSMHSHRPQLKAPPASSCYLRSLPERPLPPMPPPWPPLQFSDWERASMLQALVTSLWPGVNEFVCTQAVIQPPILLGPELKAVWRPRAAGLHAAGQPFAILGRPPTCVCSAPLGPRPCWTHPTAVAPPQGDTQGAGADPGEGRRGGAPHPPPLLWLQAPRWWASRPCQRAAARTRAVWRRFVSVGARVTGG